MVIRLSEENAMPISFLDTGGDIAEKLDQLDPAFMYSRIVKEILLSIKFEPQRHVQQFIQYCQNVIYKDTGKPTALKLFEKEYCKENAIWWYTKPSIIYQMVNNALRSMDFGVIIHMGFFIKDLHDQIYQLHHEPREQSDFNHLSRSLKLYRGQCLSREDYKKLSQTKGGLLFFNNFLSTSKDLNVAIPFAEAAADTSDMVGIVFIMSIDPKQSTTPFTSTAKVGYFKDHEAEVLFSMHTVFRIGDITPLEQNKQLSQVMLTLTKDDDKDLCRLAEYIRKQLSLSGSEWFQLGTLIERMGQPEEARKVYERLLEGSSPEEKNGLIYHELGNVCRAQGKYKEAITFYGKSLAIQQQLLPQNYDQMIASYMAIGHMCERTGDHAKALSSYGKILDILPELNASKHSFCAVMYDQIGLAYSRMHKHEETISCYKEALAIGQNTVNFKIGATSSTANDYEKARLAHEKASRIMEQELPWNHPDLATYYRNLGTAYFDMYDYETALRFYKHSLDINKKSLLDYHSDLAESYSYIAHVYYETDRNKEALSFYEKACDILGKSHRPNHPSWASLYERLGLTYSKKGEHKKALEFFKNATPTDEPSPSRNYPPWAIYYSNLSGVYFNAGDYWKAWSYQIQAMKILNVSLASNDPDLVLPYNNWADMYSKMNDYQIALFFYKKVLSIRQQSPHSNHPHLAISHSNIGEVYFKMGDNMKALSSFLEALSIRQDSLPSNHPHLAISHSNIGEVYSKMRDYDTALKYHKKAEQILLRSPSPNKSHLATFYNNMAVVYFMTNKYTKALKLFDEVLVIRETSLPPNYPQLEISYNNICGVYAKMGQQQKADDFYKKAMEMKRLSLSSNSAHSANFSENINTAHFNTSNHGRTFASHVEASATFYNNDDISYSNIDDNRKASSSFRKY